MTVSYNRLWNLLIDKNMSKTQLIKTAKMSTNAMAKLGKNEDMRVGALVKIYDVLGCTIDGIMEIIPIARQPTMAKSISWRPIRGNPPIHAGVKLTGNQYCILVLRVDFPAVRI